MKCIQMLKQRQNNRRNFLRSNLIVGLGSAATGMSFPEATASSSNQSIPQAPSTESLLSQYLKYIGGSFPEPNPLLPKRIDSIKKDGYRIEALTYEVQPSDTVWTIRESSRLSLIFILQTAIIENLLQFGYIMSYIS